jgi:putative hydrolase of the HAD superfamily
MPNIKWIFFDIGYTLVNEDDAWKERIAKQIATMENATVTSDVFLAMMIEASRQYQNNYAIVLERLQVTHKERYPAEKEVLYEDAQLVLRGLYGKYKLGIIANQIGGLSHRLQKFGILQYFDLLVSSSEVGFAKPDERIFLKAVSLAGVRPEDCLMIGDRLENDIFPAKKIGMKTLWVKQGFGKYQLPKSEEYQADFTVGSLLKILRVLKK